MYIYSYMYLSETVTRKKENTKILKENLGERKKPHPSHRNDISREGKDRNNKRNFRRKIQTNNHILGRNQIMHTNPQSNKKPFKHK